MTSKKIIREPGSGKTKDLMILCAESGATLVCKNPEAMLVKAHAYGCNINIISYLDFLQTSAFNQNNALGKKLSFGFVYGAGSNPRNYPYNLENNYSE